MNVFLIKLKFCFALENVHNREDLLNNKIKFNKYLKLAMSTFKVYWTKKFNFADISENYNN